MSKMKLEIVLTSVQQEAANSLLESLAVSPVSVLGGAAGVGKTTDSEDLCRRCGVGCIWVRRS